MCDDYDTDYDSNDEEFDRNHLIDDIQRINLALGAESDNEEDEDEVEEGRKTNRQIIQRLWLCLISEPFVLTAIKVL